MVETNAVFSCDSIRPIYAWAVPANVGELLRPHVENQDRTLRAALNCDRELVYEAFLTDPLVKGQASEAQIKQLVDDMIANPAHMLPAGWRK